MIRPEVLERLLRWREALGGAAIAASGIWVFGFGGYFYRGLGVLFVLVGLGLAISALWRLRFRGSGAAPGVVQVDEGQITYLSAEGGGFVALSELNAVTLEFDGAGRRYWVLSQTGFPTVRIPTDAEGAEALFDAFMVLPGVSAGPLIAAVNRAPSNGPVTLWRRRGASLHQLR
ncbi:hypothetical protein [Rhodovulum sp. P5]|uniref:hypothetical protein n=1 Tax=Rhodovulum sp. P5 TaxID=1564506 RepID=UPI0012EBCB36|nr:hypothetical protein [Rhodovulum sp. P5]